MNLLEASGLSKTFTVGGFGERRRTVVAVKDAAISVGRGETVALVGESGSGKSTLGRLVTRLIEPDAGEIRFDGADVRAMDPRGLRRLRRRVQMVFQDPMASLNPRQRIRDVLGRPLALHGLATTRAARTERAAELMATVGLDPAGLSRFPHEFSGGQRQRIGIARALAVEPDLLVCDEPVSALDVSVQAQIVSLLDRLKRQFGIAQLFIAHDLALVRGIADRVAVMYRGRVVEVGPVGEVFADPLHPYTATLLAAVPRIGTEPVWRRGGTTDHAADPDAAAIGCPFAPRCPRRSARCTAEEPPLATLAPGRSAACFHPLPPAPANVAATDAALRAERIALFRRALAEREPAA